jgi:hypothetical protein
MAMATHRFERVVMAVHDHRTPTDDEWGRWVQMCRERAGQDMRGFVESRTGGGPNARQRKELSYALHGVDARSAIFTDSLISRGIVTAISWMGIPIRAFASEDFRNAADYLGLTNEELATALAILPRLREECFGPSARANAR